MRTFFRIFGTIALITVIGFSFAACGGNDDDIGGSGSTPTDPVVQTPVAGDYNLGKMKQFPEIVTVVSITAKGGKSSGAVSNIQYDGSAAITQTAGAYAVTFDVAAAAGWNAATGLSAGNLVVNEPVWIEVTDSTFGSNMILCVAYGNGKWVAGGDDGKLLYLVDE